MLPLHTDNKFSFEKFDLEGFSVIVWLPPDYHYHGKPKYPVFFMNDGQNLFDSSTSFSGVAWEADITAEKMIKNNEIESFIIVGICNRGEKRIYDYAPFKDKNRNDGGGAHEYLKFLIDKLIPLIRQKYRVKIKPENNAIGGSSLGGLFSLWAAYENPKIFGKAAVISPALWWNDNKIINLIRERKGIKLWIDMGKKEGEIIPEMNNPTKSTRMLVQKLQQLGYSPSSFIYKEYENGEHNEKSWAERFPEILKFLFPYKVN
ncbi:MAG: alpha/beta hydrolase-fold protein [Candidatus Muiribacteriota bacterium]